ncbi:hypothetical protein CPHO_05095 [Corynebacterium phocae]|uniref:Uncharacterized protein n=1 Tax=Corynebacterium phocae TaxID=161895 RepID=A0A1L7D2Z9_9CORY|nr:hypothetical protein [Corynebacterium phocae]APT92371.1 hypothetical protein CPHO_05095 [Corynebacterium phocae]KAA8724963.1 hypothetical protein F4V58_04630 [Corynebacterium phocae]
MAYLLIVPSSPALVEELAPADPASRRLRHVARRMGRQYLPPEHPPKLDIVCSQDKKWRTGIAGSFRAWGAPHTQVGSGNFLGELVVRYIFPAVPVGTVATRLCDVEHGAGAVTAVAIDGSAGLTARAPLALVPHAERAHQWCLSVLAGARPEVPSESWLREAGIIEPSMWIELANISPRHAVVLAEDSSLGVGRFVAHWEV